MNEPGLRRLLDHTENQDALCFGDNERFEVIALADGVSTCGMARRGADLTSRAATNLLLKKGQFFLSFEEKKTAESVLAHVLFKLGEDANEKSIPVEAYSSTLACVLFDKETEKLLCLNLGDGLILGIENGCCRVIAKPSDSSHGCCVTTTKNAQEEMCVKILERGNLTSVILLTDGAWRQMLVNNRLREDAAALLESEAFDELKEFFSQHQSEDDYSFIAMDF